jgi:hypothetical protein
MTDSAPSIDSGLSSPSLAELQSECRFLRTQVTAILISLLVLALSVDAFFFYQVRSMRRQITELEKMVMDYQVKQAPMMDDLSAKLRDYARNHPDFQSILNKYFAPADAPPPTAPTAPTAPKR